MPAIAINKDSHRSRWVVHEIEADLAMNELGGGNENEERKRSGRWELEAERR